MWYDAVVVAYYPESDEYKIVYRSDDGVEIARLRNRRWILAPKKRPVNGIPVLDGAIVEFEYPHDGKRYLAMIYDYTHRGERLKVVYINEHSTDKLKGGGWDFVRGSPCVDDSPQETPDGQSMILSQTENVREDSCDPLLEDTREIEYETKDVIPSTPDMVRTRSRTKAVTRKIAATISENRIKAPLTRARSKNKGIIYKLNDKTSLNGKTKVASEITKRVTRSDSGRDGLRSSLRLKRGTGRSAPH